MKTILRLLLITLNIITLNSCSSDDDKEYPNTITVDGQSIELKGASILPIKERQEDFTYKYYHYLEVFGGDIKYVNLEELYNGTGFLFSVLLNAKSEDIEGATYTFNEKNGPNTFSQAGYWTSFDPDDKNLPAPSVITSGTVKIVRTGEDAIYIDVIDSNGKHIKGSYNLFIRGLYVRRD
ncbi:hypothetical protein [Aquimarina sediminis]|uniref:hypothetical protein n=1 Tax=Aquimarina sediminis TaxID=2070536 RepID=UPI000CA074A3|nr:hypothetical protein [Aquimarina sediminis]